MRLPYFRAPEANDGLGVVRGLMNAILFMVYLFGLAFAVWSIFNLAT